MGTKSIRHDLDFGSSARPINLPDPSASHHPATKGWVEALALGLRTPVAVRARATGNVDISQLNNGDTFDGLTIATNDLVLLDQQTTPGEDGIYVVGATAGTTARSTELPTGENARGQIVVVASGTAHAGEYLFNAAEAVVGTDGLSFTEIEGGVTYTAEGTAVVLVGNEIRLQLDGGTLTKGGSGVKVSTDGITTTELANNAVATANIADDAVTEDKIDTGVVARWKTFTGPASSGSTWTQAHGMGKSTLVVQVQFNTTGSTWRDVNDGLIVEVDGTNVVVDFGASVSDRSTYRVVLVG